MLHPYFKQMSGKRLLQYHLPTILNHYEVSVEEFEGLRIAQKPALVHLILQTMLRDGNLKIVSSKRGAVRKALHRCYKDALRWASVPENVSRAMIDLLEHHSNQQRMSQRGEFEAFTKMFSEYQGLYMQDGQVKARLGGTFSYDTYTFYQQQFREHFKLSCGNCNNSEVIRKPVEWIESESELMLEDLPEVLEEVCFAGTFTHLSGPYIRCAHCEQVSRAEISETNELPAGMYPDEDEWEAHQENLTYLLEQLVAHCKDHGLPEPAKLLITANRIRWDGATGYKECAVDGKELADSLRVDSEFSVNGGKLWLEPDGSGWLECSLAHHDATGHVVVEPVWLSELADRDTDEGALVSRDEFPACTTVYPEIARLLFCGSAQCFEFASASTFKVVGKLTLIEHVDWLRSKLGWTDEEIEGEGTWAVEIAGNMLIRQLLWDLRSAYTETEGQRILQFSKQLREVIDAYNVELENAHME